MSELMHPIPVSNATTATQARILPDDFITVFNMVVSPLICTSTYSNHSSFSARTNTVWAVLPMPCWKHSFP